MQIVLYLSEDGNSFEQEHLLAVVDWPNVPRVGDSVVVDQKEAIFGDVTHVFWHMDGSAHVGLIKET